MALNLALKFALEILKQKQRVFTQIWPHNFVAMFVAKFVALFLALNFLE